MTLSEGQVLWGKTKCMHMCIHIFVYIQPHIFSHTHIYLALYVLKCKKYIQIYTELNILWARFTLQVKISGPIIFIVSKNFML